MADRLKQMRLYTKTNTHTKKNNHRMHQVEYAFDIRAKLRCEPICPSIPHKLTISLTHGITVIELFFVIKICPL